MVPTLPGSWDEHVSFTEAGARLQSQGRAGHQRLAPAKAPQVSPPAICPTFLLGPAHQALPILMVTSSGTPLPRSLPGASFFPL